jgi:hypothetical protein
MRGNEAMSRAIIEACAGRGALVVCVAAVKDRLKENLVAFMSVWRKWCLDKCVGLLYTLDTAVRRSEPPYQSALARGTPAQAWATRISSK